ncbi:MAG: TadE/TadG family type IV pilus assembly protein [Xanthobacteraceae bacterium]
MQPFFAKLRNAVTDFRTDSRGNVALLFGLTVVMIFGAVGAGLDLSRAYQTRQKLAEVAMLGCQYATRSTIDAPVAASNSGTLQQADYVAAVTAYIQKSLTSQKLAQPQTNAAPFTYTAGGSAQVTLAATVPTLFMQIAHVNTIPISVTANCFTQIVQVTPNTSPYVLQEGFETHAVSSNLDWYLPSGTVYPYSDGVHTFPKVTTFNPANTYTGSDGATWVIMGYCVETDLARVGGNNTTTPQGSYSAELDCDNGSGTAGDSSISNKQYLNVGEYELRYFYRGRIDYPDYDPEYICGSAASDVSWATDTNVSYGSVSNNAKNNQIDVFLDPDNNNSAPTHLINDGSMSLAGSNLIDSCVYSNNWIQRSVRIDITTAGYYWLSFAADGTNNSFGGQLDQIQLCVATCPGSLQDNFPFTSSEALFEDTFETPTYSGSPYNTYGNMNNSDGTSSVWNESGNGWANAPTNQIPYWTSGCPQGNQCVELGWNSNSLIARHILLDPGYYQISYRYVSSVTFSNLSGVYCGSTPNAANISTLSANSGTGKDRVSGVNHSGTIANDTNTVGVFMSHAQLASTPNTGNALGSTTSYTNPDGTTTTTPTVAPNGISLTSYNSGQVNPLLDICGYAANAQTRTAYVSIQKPAYYWLTLAALGTSDAFGGQIDDVKITALTSPYYATYASSAVTIPVPSPQPSSDVTYTGFYIIADVLEPPAP